jgi:hypothetical protein
MAVRIRFRKYYECDTEAERNLDWGADSIIYTLDTSKYFKILAGDYVEIPPDEVVFASPIPLTKIAISGVADGSRFLRDDGAWADPPGGGASIFTELLDVPASYTGHALKLTRVNAGETGLEFYTLPSYQPLDADLTAIAALSGSTGFLKKTAPDTWSIDTGTYVLSSDAWLAASGVTLTGNNTITMGVNTITFSGNRVSFTPDATNAGINVGSISANPSGSITGDIWYRTSDGTYWGKHGGGNDVFAFAGSVSTNQIPYSTGVGTGRLAGSTGLTYTTSAGLSVSATNGSTITSTVASTMLTLSTGSNTGAIAMISNTVQRNRLLWTNVLPAYFESGLGVGSMNANVSSFWVNGTTLLANASTDTLTSSTRLDVRGVSGGNIWVGKDSTGTERLTFTDTGLTTIKTELGTTFRIQNAANTAALAFVTNSSNPSITQTGGNSFDISHSVGPRLMVGSAPYFVVVSGNHTTVESAGTTAPTNAATQISSIKFNLKNMIWNGTDADSGFYTFQNVASTSTNTESNLVLTYETGANYYDHKPNTVVSTLLKVNNSGGLTLGNPSSYVIVGLATSSVAGSIYIEGSATPSLTFATTSGATRQWSFISGVSGTDLTLRYAAASSTELMYFSGPNLSVGFGGTTDSTTRVGIRGISGGSILTLKDNTGSAIRFSVSDAGLLTVNGASTFNNSITLAGTNNAFANTSTLTSGGANAISHTGGYTHSSATTSSFSASGTVNTTGTAVVKVFQSAHSITAAIDYTGFYHNPTNPSNISGVHLAFHAVTGSYLAGTALPSTVGLYSVSSSTNATVNAAVYENTHAGTSAAIQMMFLNDGGRSGRITMTSQANSIFANTFFITTSANDVPLILGTNGNTPRITIGGTGVITLHTTPAAASASADKFLMRDSTGVLQELTMTGTPDGTKFFRDDGSWQSVTSGFSDPMTTRGDIIVRNASNVTARLGVGTADQVLTSDGTDVFWGSPPGGVSGGLYFKFDTSTSSADPGSGDVRYDNATPSSVANIYISETSSEGIDISTVLDNLATNDRILIRQSSDPTKAQLFQVSGSITDNGAWRTIPVTYVSGGSGGLPGNGKDLSISRVTTPPASGGYTNLTQFIAQTAWRLFYSDANGDVQELALGASGNFLQSNGASSVPTWVAPAGSGDMLLGTAQVVTASKTFDPGTLLLNDTASAFNLILGSTGTSLSANRTLSFAVNNADRLLTINGDTTLSGGTHSGTNTGDQTITLTGDVTGSGTGSFAATIANSAVTLAKMADVATASIFYRKTSGTGVPEVQTLATLKTDLGLTGTNSGDQTITLTGDVTGSGTGSFATTIGSNVVTYAKIQQSSAGFTIIAKATTGAGNYAELAAGADSILMRSGSGNLTFGTIVTNQIGTSQVTYGKIQNASAGFTILANATTGVGAYAELTAGTDSILMRSGSGNLTFGTIVTNQIGANQVTLAKMAQVATATVFYRKTAGTGDPEVQTLATLKTDLGLTGTNSGDQTSIVGITGTKAQFDTAVTDGNFMYVGDAPTAHTHTLADITDVTASATEVNLLDLSGLTAGWVLRATAATTAAWGQLLGSQISNDLGWITGNQTITLSGDVTGSGTTAITTAIGVNKVVYSMIQQASAGFTILAKATTGAGNYAELAAGTDSVLMRSGSGNITFGTIVTNQIGASQVTYAKIQNASAGYTILAKVNTGSGAYAELAASADGVLRRSGSGDLAFGSLVTANIGDSQITYAKLQNASAGYTILAKATTGSGAYTELAAITNGVLGRQGSGDLQFAQIASSQIADAQVTNAKMTNMAGYTIKGNINVGSATPQDLTGTQVTTLLDVFTTTLKGLVPASGGGTTNFLRADGTWAAPGSGGISRTVSNVSASQTLGAAATTDYIYFASSTITLTLPTAVGNTNRYTVKNVGYGTITVETTSSQLIDGELSISIFTRNNSVDLVSDGTNWNII